MSNLDSDIDAAIINLRGAILAEPSSLDLQSVSSSNWEEQWARRIQEVQELPLLLRQRRNASLAVNRLPDKIYGEIITLLQPKLEVYDQIYSAEPMNNNNSWMFATFISQRWRNAALSDHNKGLWRRIRIGEYPRNDVQAAVACFQRSSPLLVEVVHEYSDDLTSNLRQSLRNFYTLLTEEPNRLGSLYLRGVFLTDHPAIQLITKSYKNLTNFQLYMPLDSSNDETEAEEFCQTFVTQCEGLRQLSMPIIDIPTKYPQRILTNLYLYDVYINTGIYESFMAFLSRFAPSLQVLHLLNFGCTLDNSSDAASYPARPKKDRLQLGSLRHLEVHHNLYDDVVFLPFFWLRDIILPKRATIVWQYDTLSDSPLYLPENGYVAGLHPPPDWLYQVKKLICIARTPECFVVQDDTFYDGVENPGTTLGLVASLCPKLKLMAAPPFDWGSWVLDESLEFASGLRYLHLCWNNSIFTLLSALEVGLNISLTIDVPKRSIFKLSRINITSRVSIEYHDDSDRESPLFPGLQSLVIYIGKVDIDHTAAHEYTMSRVLEKIGLAPLRLDNAHEMDRKHHSGKTYSLAFRRGGQEKFNAL